MKHKYNNYFKEHYKSTFTEKDISTYQQWFYVQEKFIRSKVPINSKDTILEIGSGIGGFYSYLKKNEVNYLGIELDKSATTFANRYFGRKVFKNVAIEMVKGKSVYNTIFAFEVLEHVENPLVVVNRIHSLLKPGGIFCGTSPYPFYKNIMADDTHLFVLHPKNWERVFLMHGFKSVTLYPMSFFPLLWRVHERLNFRLPFYIPFNYFISTCLIIAVK